MIGELLSKDFGELEESHWTLRLVTGFVLSKANILTFSK